MVVFPGTCNKVAIGTAILAPEIGVGQDAEKTAREFLLRKEFDAVGAAVTGAGYGFVAQYIKIAAEIGERNAIAHRNGHLRIMLVKCFQRKTARGCGQEFKTSCNMIASDVGRVFIDQCSCIVGKAQD